MPTLTASPMLAADEGPQAPAARPMPQSLESSDPQPTRVIVFSSQKGGSGKTTLCGQLAVQAERAGQGPVAVVDTDPQGSLADWWNARQHETPAFICTRVDRLIEDIEELRMMGFQLVFVDTQPSVTQVIREIVNSADLVVIPTRPSPHDLRAVGATLDIVEGQNKPLVFAINAATKRARINADVAVALSQHGTVAPVTVHQRTDFATSMIDGGTVMEANPDGPSAEEIAGLWEYLRARLERLTRAGDNMTFETTGPATPPIPVAEAPASDTWGRREFDRPLGQRSFGRRTVPGEEL